MKEYQEPTLELVVLYAEDILMVSFDKGKEDLDWE